MHDRVQAWPSGKMVLVLNMSRRQTLLRHPSHMQIKSNAPWTALFLLIAF